jgi:hypothetical protein
MSFEEGRELITKLGLRMQLFGKDLEKLFKNEKCTVFLVVTSSHGDELYHPENLTDPKEMSLLRGWIRCGDPAGCSPEWRTIEYRKANIKVYLAGQDPGIDCTSVKDEMFAEEGGKNFTYTCYGGDLHAKRFERISHPQEHLQLSIQHKNVLKAKANCSAR